MKLSMRAAALAVSLISLSAATAQASELTIVVSAGAFADALEEAFVKPFVAETGIKVNTVKTELSMQRWGLAVDTNTVNWDVGLMGMQGHQLARQGAITPIDYSIYAPEELAGIPPEFRPEWGVTAQVSGLVLAYNTETLPEGKRPQSWADFWNAEDFPGNRTLMMPVYGTSSLPEALVADGAPLDEVYPHDLDRAFAKLDAIKPHIRSWWSSAGEAQQMFSSGGVDMGLMYDGRVVTLQKDGNPIDFTFNGARYYTAYWSIPKGAPNVEEAQKFVEFATRGEHQAKLAELMGYAPGNTNAYKYISDELAATLITAPGNIETAYPIDSAWYFEVGEDGKTNSERILERFQEWLLK